MNDVMCHVGTFLRMIAEYKQDFKHGCHSNLPLQIFSMDPCHIYQRSDCMVILRLRIDSLLR